jgi:hypothetical protein
MSEWPRKENQNFVFAGNEGVWLPAIQEQLALDRKNPASALNALQAVSPIMRRESNETEFQPV